MNNFYKLFLWRSGCRSAFSSNTFSSNIFLARQWAANNLFAAKSRYTSKNTKSFLSLLFRWTWSVLFVLFGLLSAEDWLIFTFKHCTALQHRFKQKFVTRALIFFFSWCYYYYYYSYLHSSFLSLSATWTLFTEILMLTLLIDPQNEVAYLFSVDIYVFCEGYGIEP